MIPLFSLKKPFYKQLYSTSVTPNVVCLSNIPNYVDCICRNEDFVT